VAAGIADVILLRSGPGGPTRHRVQIGFYATLLRQMAEQAGVAIEELTGAV
jgi:hypothetical protein